MNDDIMIFQIVRARSQKKHFVVWVITLGPNLNAEVCFN